MAQDADDSGDDFDVPRHTVDIEQYGFNQDNYPDVATKAELDQLIAGRAEPAPQFNMPGPGGDIVQEVNQQIEAEREERIDYLADRLQVAQENFEHDFDLATGPDLDP